MKEIRITESNMSEALTQIETLDGLSPKDSSCLRLLTEEMFSMCKELLGAGTLDFEVRRDNGRYALQISTKTRVDEEARQHFLSMSSKGKNAANQGIKGMLGAVLEALESGAGQELSASAWAYGLSIPGDEYVSMWTLSQYIESAPKEKIKNEWDGMEKSIIANFADDVSIGVRNNKLEMTVIKTL